MTRTSEPDLPDLTAEFYYTVAVHESGHTLMAYLLNVRFLYVTIEGGEELEHGRLQIEDDPDPTLDLTVAANRETAEQHILIRLAGFIAQQRDNQAAKSMMHSMDHIEAWEWCQRLAGKPSVLPRGPEWFQLLRAGCCERHSRMVNGHFDRRGEKYDLAMQAVVSALLEKRTVSSDEVTAVLSSVGIG